MTIDVYLAELERALPRTARLRALREVREHLRDSAAHYRSAGLCEKEAEDRATAEFGSAAEVARRLGAELAVGETRLASVLAVLGVAFFVFPLYVVPENVLPPAPWPEQPWELVVLQRVAIAFWVFAGGFAVASALLACTPRAVATARSLSLAALSLAVSSLVSVALVARWFTLTPVSAEWGIAAPLALVCVVACSAAALWARSSARRLAGSSR